MNFSDFKAELKDRCDIATVIGRYIQLEKKGNTYWGRCPFHHENTASFAVNQVDQYYHCFGCKESGDVIKFVEKFDSIDFIDAVKKLADSVGMTLPDKYESEQITKLKENKDRLFQLLKDAAKRYYQNLKTKEGQKALDYLTRRGLSPKTIAAFGLGVSINAFDMIDYLRGKGYSVADMTSAGVALVKDGTDRVYDAFAERVMFPIINRFGDVIGFGGRSLNPDAHAKYRNTSQTPLFDKKNVLYGINNLVKIKREGGLSSVIIVEGYMDAISLYQGGFTNVLASMGTALTARQVRQIKLLSENVYICYDGDSAGRMATMRGLEILRDEGCNIRVVSLPDGLDPDDVIRSGEGNFKKLLDDALTLTDYKLKIVASGINLDTIDGKTEYAIKAIEVIAEIDNTIEQERYIKYIHDVTGYSTAYLKKQLEAEPEAKPIVIQEPQEREVLSDITRAIRFILRAGLEGRHIDDFPDIYNYLENDAQQRIYNYIVDSAKKGIKPLISNLFEMLDESQHTDIGKILEVEAGTFKNDEDYNAYLVNCIKKVGLYDLNKERDRLNDALKRVVHNDEQNLLLQKIKEYDTKIKALKRSNTDE